MSKRTQEFQGGEERYAGMSGASRDTPDVPKNATAAQMARRKIAQARKPSGSQRSSRQGTPTGNVFGQQGGQQQSMPSFQPPSGPSGTGFGGGFNFAVNNSSNPFAQTNGASGTPPPTGFQFGGESQQNEGGGVFGSNNNATTTTSFGSTFGGSSNTQPQQNGFAPSTTSFGQSQPSNGNNTTPSVFGGFGQDSQSQPQQNGLAPSTATPSSFPSFGKQNTNDNPFKSFGQSQQPSQSTPSSSFTFGQSTQQNGDKPPKSPFTFGQPAQSQSNGGQSIFSSTTQAEQTPKSATTNAFSGFGQQSRDQHTPQPEQALRPTSSESQASAAKGLFGSSTPAESGSQAPKLGESIFSSLNKKEGISANMFTSSRDSTPKPSGANLFTAGSQQSESNSVGQTPKPANVFGGFSQSQTNGVKPNLFGNPATASQTEPQTPKANPFSSTFGQQGSQTSGTPAFKFGQVQEQDTSMTTPGNTPQKQSEANTARPLSSTEQESTAQSGKSLFDRVSPRDDPPPTAQKPMFTPSTTMFNTPSASNGDSQTTPASSQGNNLFDRISPRDPPVTAFKPTSTPSTSSSQPSAAPWLTHGPSALTKGAQSAPPQPPPTTALSNKTASSAKEAIPAAEKNTFKVLNEGLRAHLATQDPSVDWSSIMQYYVAQAAKITNSHNSPGSNVPSLSITAASASNTPQKQTQGAPNVFASQSSASATSKSNGSLFGTATPKTTGAANLLKPPQTAPVNRKRRAEEEDEAVQPPATEKRARANAAPEYPKLPENASETAKLFQAALDRSTGMTPNAPAKSSLQGPSQQEKERLEREAEQAKKVEEKEKQAHTASFGGFKPSTSGFTPSSGGFQPSSGGFTPANGNSTQSALPGMPTFSAPGAGSGGFLAAFGKRATEQEEKDKKKRKAEDYDSDEETEEAWAARDKAEQDAKRQKIMAAAKSGAGFTPSDAGTPAPESDDGRGSEKETETPAAKGKSLFDRITSHDAPATAPSKTGFFPSQTPALSKTSTNLFGSKTPSGLGTSSTSSNIFGSISKPRESIEKADGDKTEGEKDQGTGDNTWKPNTPIKFGGGDASTFGSTTPAAPPPAFGNLFGSLSSSKAGTEGAGHLGVPKPSFGFNFGGQPSSAGNSRATTPGVTTDGEGASTAGEGEGEDEDAAAQTEPQVEDQTGLRDSEKEEEDLLFNVKIAKAMKWDEKKTDAGEISMGWVDRGKGPLYILKHKQTGKVRVVLKVPPYGVTKMNFTPLKDILYEVVGKGGKMVQGVFLDHLEGKETKLSKWMLQVGKKEDAEEIAAVLMRERA